jgi:DNA-binding MarR family transcriptional regulator
MHGCGDRAAGKDNLMHPSFATGSEPAGIHPGWFEIVSITDADLDAEPDPAHDERIRYRAFQDVLRTASALDRAATDVLADLDLTAGAFFALIELGAESPRGLAPSELARRLGVARRTATLYVDILERNGWAARHPHPDDRRMVLAALTTTGAELVARVGEAYAFRLARLLGDLAAPQAARLTELLGELAADRVLARSRGAL